MRRTTMLLVALLLTACTSHGSTTTPPTQLATSTAPPTSSATPTKAATPALTAQDVIDDPQAHLGSLAILPDDQDVRLASWYVCLTPTCQATRWALLVTDDGFRTRNVVDLPARPNAYQFDALGSGRFLVRDVHQVGVLVDARGVRHPVTPAARPTAPLRRGEVPVASGRGFGWLALNPTTGFQHPLSTPPHAVELYAAPSGQLRAVSGFGSRWRWLVSDDRGASWRSVPIPDTHGRLVQVLPSAGSRIAVAVGGDGATLFPWERVLRSDDGGRTWTSYDGPRRPWAYLDAGAVLPDGRLVVDVVSWSDARAGRPSRHSVGLFTGSDWSRPLPPAGGGPQPTVLATVVRADVVSMWVSTSDGLRRTDDGGETWHAERAR